MSNYKGNYANDFNKIAYLTKLEVFLFRIVGDNSFRENTNAETDAQYLPSIYLDNVTAFNRGDATCPNNLVLRYAKLFINAADYLHVDLPFKPGTIEYSTFFREVNDNNLIITVGLKGERIDPYYLRVNAKL